MNPSQGKNYLTSEEVCSILTKCGETGVSKLQFRDLCVEFSPKSPSIPTYAPHGIPNSIESGPLPRAERKLSELQDREAETSLVKDEISARDEQIAELLLNDPVVAEQMYINGALEEPEDGPGE